MVVWMAVRWVATKAWTRVAYWAVSRADTLVAERAASLAVLSVETKADLMVAYLVVRMVASLAELSG